ncbi:hypothetical protein, partial [Streptomyces albidus (ex Kaewkla and Franco 2022)]|uniref:hypothetical protein n=1 Tax=Streptomyces albidus (ex Kaewkla and Franco 2022) TaxID=722709 RepID=UPI0015EE6D0B
MTTPSLISHLTHSAAVLLPADPPRTSRMAFWNPDGTPPLPDRDVLEDLTVALPDGDGTVRPRTLPALVLSVRDALPVLTRARAAHDQQGQ